MSSTSENGGPAFPAQWLNESDRNATAPDGQHVPPFCLVYMPGMSLRDYFAGQALVGLLATYSCDEFDPLASRESREGIATDCYAMADAMIAERKR